MTNRSSLKIQNAWSISALFHTTYDMVIGEAQKQLFHVTGKKVCMRRRVSTCRQQAAVNITEANTVHVIDAGAEMKCFLLVLHVK